MTKFNFKPEQRTRLMAKADARREIIQCVYKDLDKIADKVDDLRADVLREYPDFGCRNKYTHEYWAQIETALEGLYGAMNALKNLSAIELCKWGKLHSPD